MTPEYLSLSLSLFSGDGFICTCPLPAHPPRPPTPEISSPSPTCGIERSGVRWSGLGSLDQFLPRFCSRNRTFFLTVAVSAVFLLFSLHVRLHPPARPHAFPPPTSPPPTGASPNERKTGNVPTGSYFNMDSGRCWRGRTSVRK